MNIIRCSIISRRRAERDNGERCFFRGLCLRKKNAIVQKREKNIICLMCVGHMMHMKHMKFEKGFFERTAGANAFQRMGCELLPPPANSFHRLRAVPLPRRGRSWGGGIGSWWNVGRNCNCEMHLQRWVASLQRLDAFATVGCIAVLCRGAHRAPVYPRCYNNLSRGRAKGYRGDRKAPICNRRQGRRP